VCNPECPQYDACHCPTADPCDCPGAALCFANCGGDGFDLGQCLATADCNPFFGGDPVCNPKCGGDPCKSPHCEGFNADCDLAAFFQCMGGPNKLPTPLPPVTALNCLKLFEQSNDNDVDLRDAAEYLRLLP
jgi:hypothetical protein